MQKNKLEEKKELEKKCREDKLTLRWQYLISSLRWEEMVSLRYKDALKRYN